MSALRALRDGEDGFTLVELLTATVISLTILFAVLKVFDAFTTSTAHQTRITDANEQVRSTMDHTVSDLRGASVILRAGATDLVYAVGETAGSRIQRLCVESSQLYFSSTVTAATPAAPAAACSSGTKLATLRSTANTAFTYDGAASSATPSLVKNVGLTFSLDTSGYQKTGSSTLRASAARRSAATTLLTTPDDLGATCDATGALLTLDVSLTGGVAVGPLTVAYTNDAGVSLGVPTGTTLHIPKGVTHVVARVTDALGVTDTIQRTVECV